MKEINNFLEEFSLKKNPSPTTITAYEKDLTDFALYIKNNNLDMFNLTEEEYINYFEDLKKVFKITSLKRKQSSLKAFYKYLWKNKLVEKIFEYNFSDDNSKILHQKDFQPPIYLDNDSFKLFMDSLDEDNLYDMRIKVIANLIAKLNINLINIFEIQIRDLIKYDFKKIIIYRNNKIYNYDLDNDIGELLRNYYKKYAFEKRFLFSTYNINAFRKDLKKFNIDISDLKFVFTEDDESLYNNIKKIYFEIGIGD
ncbi:site-specific integrase [Fusobacterium sp.]|uniref:tyrosine-type recombinase/integrase n=1 Tax=Fusobacterium sp. TaxID=68766 RepID=UPI0025B934D0|nr:site-specific integrase [Fusobacterium sp.]MCI7223893.1 site-specific integrase [Fusobacterium sp.]